MTDEIYPKSLKINNTVNARLGIKSSFKNPKRNIALLYLLWVSNHELAMYEFFEENKSGIMIKPKYLDGVFQNIKRFLEPEVTAESFYLEINQFELVRSQIEPLQVALQLLWRLAKIDFTNEDISNSAERTGIERYPKTIHYTNNIDLIKYAFLNEEDDLIQLLTSWLVEKSDSIGFKVNKSDDELKKTNVKMVSILSFLSENAVFKMVKHENHADINLLFRKAGIYSALSDKRNITGTVNIRGVKEVKGPLRVLSSAISDGIEAYLDPEKVGEVKLSGLSGGKNKTEQYESRLLTTDCLSRVNIPDVNIDNKHTSVNSTKGIGRNIIYYGAPGTGKSYDVTQYIRKNGIKEYDASVGNEYVFRVTLYPDFSYSDFVGQLMPVVKSDKDDSGQKNISYDFKPGMFTVALKKAINHPDKPVFLIMEEMSRANVAAVFGDLFQLLDRNEQGKSEYTINNELIANQIFPDDPGTSIYLPNNLMIIGTVNTNDQNVFAMDTAFKRRFEWHYVSTHVGNDFNNNPKIRIVGLGAETVSWKRLFMALNDFIVNKLNLTEDKQIGPYFIKFPRTVNGSIDDDKVDSLIKNKLLQYLWEDVESVADMSSQNRLFDESITSFSTLYDCFQNNKRIFSMQFIMQLNTELEA